PRSRTSRESLRRTDRRGGEPQGRRSTGNPAAPGGVSRNATGEPRSAEDGQDTGGSRRSKAAHAGPQGVALPRAGARRESDAARLYRGLPRPEDRHHRRPGQPAADAEVGEVLRGDAADRAHGAPRRRAAARDLLEDLARVVRGTQGADE